MRARAGDSASVGILLSHYEREIRLVVRHKLPRRLRGRYDSMDFVQSVYQSIMTDWIDSTFAGFETPAQVSAYLRNTAANKVLEIYRRETRTQKYDIGREVSISSLEQGSPDSQVAFLEPVSPDPSPSQQAMAGDLKEKLVRGRPAVVGQILDLREEGLTFQEIADRVGLSERSVRRTLEDIRNHNK